jgi:lipopolysaccharide exporter
LLGICSGVAAAGWVSCHWKAFRFDRRLARIDLKRNWGFAKYVFGSAIVWQSGTYLYPWILTAFHGTSATGTWAACSAIVAAGNPVLLGLTNYISPTIANVYATAGPLAMKRFVHRSSLLLAALLFPFVALLAAGGDRILVAIYGAQYAGGGRVVLLLSINMLVNSMGGPFAQGLFNLQRARADMLVNVISLITLFSVGIMAMKSYAVVGAAAALFASSVIALVVRAVVFGRNPRAVLEVGA